MRAWQRLRGWFDDSPIGLWLFVRRVNRRYPVTREEADRIWAEQRRRAGV